MLEKIHCLSTKSAGKNLRNSFILTLLFLLVACCTYFVRESKYSEEYLLKKANEYYSNEEHFEARKCFAKAGKLKGLDAQSYKKYGISLLMTGGYDSAAKCFRIASSVASHDEDVSYFLGHALFRKARNNIGDKETFLRAIKHFERAVELYPDSEKLYLLAGVCCRHGSLHKKAIIFYTKALTSNKFSKTRFHNLIDDTRREEDNDD